MLYARTPCIVRKRLGTDAYGQPRYGEPVDALCGIVRLGGGVQKTSVRTDSSASRGNADEVVADARLLFPTLYRITPGSMIEVLGQRIEVTTVQPRLAVFGMHDHDEVDGNLAPEEAPDGNEG